MRTEAIVAIAYRAYCTTKRWKHKGCVAKVLGEYPSAPTRLAGTKRVSGSLLGRDRHAIIMQGRTNPLDTLAGNSAPIYDRLTACLTGNPIHTSSSKCTTCGGRKGHGSYRSILAYMKRCAAVLQRLTMSASEPDCTADPFPCFSQPTHASVSLAFATVDTSSMRLCEGLSLKMVMPGPVQGFHGKERIESTIAGRRPW